MRPERKEKIIRMIKYTLFAASAGVIQIFSFTLLTEVTPLPYWPRYLISLVLSVVWNFTFNRRFTFKSANNVPIAMLKVLAYYCVFTPASTLLGHYLVESAGWNDYVVEIINMLLNFVTEFLYQRFFVFGKSLNTNDLAKKEKEKEDNKASEADAPTAPLDEAAATTAEDPTDKVGEEE